MRDCAKASATSAGTCAFIAQVRSSWPAEPNLRPAMNTTLGHFGSASICLRSRRSAAMHSMSEALSCSRRPCSLKRATPTTRLPGAARLARRASVGPILPPTPRTMISPESVSNAARKGADGVVITSSRCSTSRKRSGSAAGCWVIEFLGGGCAGYKDTLQVTRWILAGERDRQQVRLSDVLPDLGTRKERATSDVFRRHAAARSATFRHRFRGGSRKRFFASAGRAILPTKGGLYTIVPLARNAEWAAFHGRPRTRSKEYSAKPD